MARIFARALNCEAGPTPEPCGTCEPCRSIAQGTDVDVIEIDGASNRGVEDARRLRQSVSIAPSRSRLKIYIIDEVHMLTPESFNTLLKTLEEPPPHVKFIMATTEAHKILDTIHSRCQRFDFRRISQRDIVTRLQQICEREQVEAEPTVLQTIARAARGGMRDSQSLLDQVISFSPDGQVTQEQLERILGRLTQADLRELLASVIKGDAVAALRGVGQVYERGLDPEGFLEQLVDDLRSLLILRACGPRSAAVILDASPEEVAALEQLGGELDTDRISSMLAILLETASRLRSPAETQPRLVLELGLYQLAASAQLVPVGEILTRLERLEGGGGGPAGAPASPAPPRQPSPSRPPAPPPPRSSPQRRQGRRPRSPRPPEPPPPEEPAGASPGPPSLATIRHRWPDLVQTIEAEHHELGALLHDATPAGVDGGQLRLELPPGYQGHCELLEEQQLRSELARRLGELLQVGAPLGVELGVAGAAAPGSSPAAAEPAPAEPARPDDPRRHLRDPRILEAIRVLGGTVVGVEERT
jgi:DNA polymerase-3 subunit gamma/tau